MWSCFTELPEFSGDAEGHKNAACEVYKKAHLHLTDGKANKSIVDTPAFYDFFSHFARFTSDALDDSE